MALSKLSEKFLAVRWGFWLGLVFFAAVITWSVMIALQIKRSAVDENNLPVRHVQLLGDKNYTLDGEVLRVLPQQLLSSFIALNVDEVQQRIEALPWVKSASVRKQWPDTLKVYLTEQRPVAHWNSDMMLNNAGQAFQLDAYKVVNKLPQLYGPEGSEAEVLGGYRDLQQLMAQSAIGIEEVTLSERYSWRITIADEVQVHLGREDKIKRMQRFIDFYPQLQQQKNAVAYVDLRYDTGFAVGWKK